MKSNPVATCVLALALLSPITATTVEAAPNRAGIVVISLGELNAGVAAQVDSAAEPVVIEFYDPQDPDASGECARQLPAFVSAQSQFAGKVALVRADVRAQNQNMISRARIAVCPTHLFVLEKNGNTLVAKRIWGYLSEAQFQELFQELYNIQP